MFSTPEVKLMAPAAEPFLTVLYFTAQKRDRGSALWRVRLYCQNSTLQIEKKVRPSIRLWAITSRTNRHTKVVSQFTNCMAHVCEINFPRTCNKCLTNQYTQYNQPKLIDWYWLIWPINNDQYSLTNYLNCYWLSLIFIDNQ